MSLTVGKNLASLVAQRQLKESSNNLSTIFERLSSGQRTDDAAGLAIADGLRSDARAYGQALNITDSALNELKNVTIRIQELANQAASGSYTSEQRAALDEEAQALTSEFVRIRDMSKFNGISLFEEDSSVFIQAGIDSTVNSRIELSAGTPELEAGNGANGDRTFSATELSDGGDQLNSLKFGDFNNDGNVDVAYTEFDNDVKIRLGGVGGFP